MIKKINLNGQWDFVADLDPKYHNDISIHGVIANSRPDINRRHWKKVQVPGVWQKYGERYDIYEGVCWFVREFSIDDYIEVTPSFLRFGAVNYLCRVFLNGVEVGGHETGYTEFTLDVTNTLKRGKNHLAVMVDNRALVTKWPPCLGYFNYGGIHRDVMLEIMEGPCLKDVWVHGDYVDGECLLKISGRVQGQTTEKGNESMRIEAACCEQSIKIPVDAEGSFKLEMNMEKAAPWTPDSPQLYNTFMKLMEGNQEMDHDTFEIGFKRIEMKNGRVMLNGADLRFKGVCYVYDSPETGLVMMEEQVYKDVRLMKEMGCNAVRCHYPMDRRFYEACDRVGILVWIEPTVYCYHPKDDAQNTAFSNPDWTGLAEQMIQEMIGVARKHVSVSIYGIGNECNTANPEAEEFFKSLAAVARQNDPYRLISYAALYGIVGPIADIVDVVGVNSYWGWYDKIDGGKGLKPEDGSWQKDAESGMEPIDLTPMRNMLEEIMKNGPKNLALLLTEFGADSVPGYFSRSRDLWSEDYHAALLDEIFTLAENYPQIIGTFPFCFTDYRDPSKPVNGYWNEQNLKGLVTYERRKKMSYGAAQRYYKNIEK